MTGGRAVCGIDIGEGDRSAIRERAAFGNCPNDVNRRRDGRIIRAGHGHRDGAGGCPATAVVDGVGEYIIAGFAKGQALHRTVGVVEGIGITPIGGDIDFSVGAVYVTGKVTRLNAAHVAGCHPLY